MTIRQDEGQWWAECDDCGDCVDVGEPEWEFREVAAHLLELGWTRKLVHGEWDNYCPGCSNPEEMSADDYEALF